MNNLCKEKEDSKGTSALWNQWNLLPPDPFTLKTEINQKSKRKVLQLRENLYQVRNTLNNLDCLHAEAVTLSRILYRFYNPLKKDKGYQLMKIIMTALNKFLRMNIVESIDEVRRNMPIRFLPFVVETDLPTQAVIGWLLSKFQGMAALFYRIHHLTKKAGRFIYQRLRLLWNPTVLILCLGLAARIHVISKYLVLQCVSWHSSLIPHIKCLRKPANNPYQSFPEDLKSWLGGLDDLAKPSEKDVSTMDLVFQLIDLTKDDDNGLVQIINDLSDEDEEVKRVYEMVDLDAPQKPPLKVEQENNDDTILLNDSESEDIGEAVSEKIDEIVLDETEDRSRWPGPSVSPKFMDGSRKRKSEWLDGPKKKKSFITNNKKETLKKKKHLNNNNNRRQLSPAVVSKKGKKKRTMNNSSTSSQQSPGRKPIKKKNNRRLNKFVES